MKVSKIQPKGFKKAFILPAPTVLIGLSIQTQDNEIDKLLAGLFPGAFASIDSKGSVIVEDMETEDNFDEVLFEHGC